jgi:hypothetical protein
VVAHVGFAQVVHHIEELRRRADGQALEPDLVANLGRQPCEVAEGAWRRRGGGWRPLGGLGVGPSGLDGVCVLPEHGDLLKRPTEQRVVPLSPVPRRSVQLAVLPELGDAVSPPVDALKLHLRRRTVSIAVFRVQ